MGIMDDIKLYLVFLVLEICLVIWLEEISLWFVVFDGDVFVFRFGSFVDNLFLYIWCIVVRCCIIVFNIFVICYFFC